MALADSHALNDAPPLDDAPSLDEALQFHRDGRAAEAEAAYRAVLAVDPEQPTVPPLLGMLLLRAGRPKEAIPLLARAATLRPDDPETALAHANALYSDGRAQDAAVAYRAILERWPRKAAAWSNLAEALRAQGDNQAALDAADRAIAILPGLAEGHLGRGNALLALRRDVDAEAAFAAALASNPGLAAAETSRAAVLLRLGRANEAADAAKRAVDLAADVAEAQFVLGCAERSRGAHEASIAAFREATRIDPDHAGAWLNLGNAMTELDQLTSAETCYRNALATDPDFAEAHSSLGCLYTQTRRLDEALAEFEKAVALRPDYAEAHWNQGFCLLLAGEFAQGWEKYEWRKRHDRFAQTFPTLAGPAWEGEDLTGRTLLVYAEQGLGDTIQFVRYAEKLAKDGARIVLACDRKLLPLMAGLPFLAAVVARNGDLPAYDFWIDQMSLPRVTGTRLDSIPYNGPYLAADPARIAAWRNILPAGRKIGIVWAGNPTHSNDRKRSAPYAAMRALLTVPDTHIVSLQVGAAAADAKKIRADVIDISGRLHDFAETAAAIANLDMVIAVDTAVAHLAGAMGVPVYTMIPHAPDWRWLLDREDTPWYASMRLFRQSAPGDWASVVEAIRRALTPR